MAYLDTFLTKTPAELIAEQAPQLERGLAGRLPTYASRTISHGEAAANQAYIAGVMEELRSIWRLAHAGDETWRTALVEFAEAYGLYDNVSHVRFKLIAKGAGLAATRTGGTS